MNKDQLKEDMMFDMLLRQVDMVENSSRCTGRTTNAIMSLSKDDVFVVHRYDMKGEAERMIRERCIPAIHNSVKIVQAQSFSELRERLKGYTFNKVIFDNCARYLILKNEIELIQRKFNIVDQDKGRLTI